MRSNLLWFKMDAKAKFPVKKREGDAGFDLYSIEQVTIKPGKRVVVRTGIGIALPSDAVGIIKDRSGLAAKGLHILGGVIDENYRGEIKVILVNLSDEEIELPAFSRIAQLLVLPLWKGRVFYANRPPNDKTERGNKGFGSSGITD